MSLPALSIRRPVLIVMLTLLIILVGLISIQRLGLDRLPKIEIPQITITTTLLGANPELMDRNVTQVIESAVNSISDIDYIASASLPGVSIVAIIFGLNKDLDVAFTDVQAKIIRIFKDLPKDIDLPIIEKLQAGATPILWLNLEGDRTLQQLNLYATENIKKRLQNIAGVGDVILGGERMRTLRVNLDPVKMAKYNIISQDVLASLQREHISLPGGFITVGKTERLVNLNLEFHSAKNLSKLIVAYRNNAPIHLDQIAKVEDELDDKRTVARFNGKPVVGLGIIKIPGSNTVAIIKEIKKRLAEEIIPSLPAGMKIHIAADDSFIILEIVNALNEHLVEGTLLAAFVVWLFLRDLRSTIIIAISIPVSLLGAIGSMYLAGFTFNVLTLLALLLLIGIVVDDSIVVLENIHRSFEREKGERDTIALTATDRVMFAVLASTFTIVSIFVPVIFLGGIIGRFFQSFAIVVTVGVLISLFISLSLTPMLCAKYLKVVKHHNAVYRILENSFIKIEQNYEKLLNWSLNNRWKLLTITLFMLIGSGFVFAHLGKEFLPRIDEGRFLINLKTPLGSSLDYTSDRMQKIENMLARHPEVKTYFSTIGTAAFSEITRGQIYVQLVDRKDRNIKQYRFIDQLHNELIQIPGVKAFPSLPALIGSGRGEPLQFVLQGPNLKKVGELSEELKRRLEKISALGTVDTDLQLEQPQFQLSVDRERAQSVGLDTQTIAQGFSLLTGGLNAMKFNDEEGSGERYYIRLKMPDGIVVQPRDLSHIFLHNAQGKSIRMDNVATLTPIIGPASITRSDLLYATNFYSEPTIPLGEAVNLVNQAVKGMLPLGYQIKMRGQAEEFAKTESYVSFTLIMAVLLVYMVLASQFNSFIQPIALMLALPLAIIGGLVGLWIAGMTMNIYSMIGMILLMGLVAKNSILLIDLTNQFRSDGFDIDEALRRACPQRMRPVLMTSLTIILALLPAALGRGAGADTNGPLAVTIIGGMVTSTLLTLIVIPAVYSLIEHKLLIKK